MPHSGKKHIYFMENRCDGNKFLGLCEYLFPSVITQCSLMET